MSMVEQREVPAPPGALALVGSGEYTDAMNATDSLLLETLGGAAAARVALLPTASGLEGERPRGWNELGLAHFRALGVRDIRPTMILDASSAADPEQLALLTDANFYYFSGGDPQHTIRALRGSPAWQIIVAAHARGAVLAGCSAGAMLMGGHTLSLRRAAMQGVALAQVEWQDALGVVPGVVVFPHFDRMRGFISAEGLGHVVSQLPAGEVALGIDEDTALVRLMATSPARWCVMGRQTVSLFTREAEPRIFHPGDEVEL